MKTLIICDSIHHGNTRKIADIFAKILDARVLTSTEVSESILREYELIGFGSGIYMGKHSKNLLSLVDLMPNTSGKNAFIFSTSGFGESFMEKHHSALKRRLEEKGFKIAGEFSCKAFDNFGPFKFIGGINRGRPNEKDFEKAKLFAEGLKGER